MVCATKSYPAIYTRISYFNDWIESYIHNNNQTTTSDNKTINYRVLYRCDQHTTQCGCSHRNVVLSPSAMIRSENALPYTWSMVVSIRIGSNNQHVCSGTILEESHILTAAHCLTNHSLHDITIEAGMYYRSENDAVIRQVDHIYIHPNYSIHSDLYINDIAILHLSQPLYIEYNKYLSRTCRPVMFNQWLNETEYPLNRTRLTIVGWDITNMSSFPKSMILQQAEVYVTDDDDNANCSVSDNRRSIQFCAGRYESENGNIITLNGFF